MNNPYPKDEALKAKALEILSSSASKVKGKTKDAHETWHAPMSPKCKPHKLVSTSSMGIGYRQDVHYRGGALSVRSLLSPVRKS